MAHHPTFLKKFRLYNNQPFLKIMEIGRRRKINKPMISPKIWLELARIHPLEKFEIVTSLTCHIIESTQKI